MIDALRFVQGAVARKDYVPALTHFRIENGHVLGFNGAIALSSPIEFPLACSPQAKPFVKAVQTCQDTIQLHLTPNGRLSVKSGAFTAFVECINEPFPDLKPEGQEYDLQHVDLIAALRTLVPFIAEDASRPWAQGILFRGGSAYATNNIVLIERWLEGVEFPVPLNIPKEAVTELIRIGENPFKVTVAPESVTFHFSEGRWLLARLATGEWPNMESVLDQPSAPSTLPGGFFAAITDLAPFTNDLDQLFFLPGKVATAQVEDSGASEELAGLPDKGCFNAKQLLLLEPVATEIDFSAYPRPCTFQGELTRGVIVGMHV